VPNSKPNQVMNLNLPLPNTTIGLSLDPLGIPFDDIVASGGIPTRGQGVKHVGIFVGTILAFCFSEIGPRNEARASWES
jgi:hypothetical protein